MTDPRRYNDDEVAEIFLRAAEGPALPVRASRVEGMTLAQLQDIGREVGIAPDAVAQAAHALDARGQGRSRRLFGLPIAVERTVALNRWLSDAEWERLVVELRDVFQAPGTVKSYGSLRQWTNGNLHVLLEPTPTGHRLRLGSLKGSAQSSISAGFVLLALSGAAAVAGAFGSGVGHVLPGIAILGLGGIGMIANGALGLPRWARLRTSQMEGIAARLARPADAPPTALPPTPQG